MCAMPACRILLVEDAEEVADLLRPVLETGAHEVRVASSGEAGLALAQAWRPDVVVLDLGLPDIDGVEVCRRLRTFSQAYVLMLTGRADEVDRIVGLNMGADDYVTKPFSPREVLARVEALLRRMRPAGDPPEAPPAAAPVAAEHPGVRRFGPLLLDLEAREVAVDGVQVELTRTEFELLDALTEAPRRVHTRDALRERGWGGGWFGDDHAVDVHVSNLRRKLRKAGAADVVTTVRGVGYRLSPAVQQANA